jgi:hypothetical protein
MPEQLNPNPSPIEGYAGDAQAAPDAGTGLPAQVGELPPELQRIVRDAAENGATVTAGPTPLETVPTQQVGPTQEGQTSPAMQAVIAEMRAHGMQVEVRHTPARDTSVRAASRAAIADVMSLFKRGK